MSLILALLGALSLFAAAPAEAQSLNPPVTNVRLHSLDGALLLVWDRIPLSVNQFGLPIGRRTPGDWNYKSLRVRWRVKDTNPGTSGDQPGSWLPPDSTNDENRNDGVEMSPSAIDKRLTLPDPGCGLCAQLINGTAYEVQWIFYRADEDGNTGWRNVGTATPMAESNTDHSTALAQVKIVRLVPGNGTITVNWDTVPGANKYVVQYGPLVNQRTLYAGKCDSEEAKAGGYSDGRGEDDCYLTLAQYMKSANDHPFHTKVLSTEESWNLLKIPVGNVQTYTITGKESRHGKGDGRDGRDAAYQRDEPEPQCCPLVNAVQNNDPNLWGGAVTYQVRVYAEDTSGIRLDGPWSEWEYYKPGGVAGASGSTPQGSSGTGNPPGGNGGTPPGGVPQPEPLGDGENSSSIDANSCGENDRENLERFYDAAGGDGPENGEGWERKDNWGDSEQPLDQWYGVKTDEDGEVVSLRLTDNNLSGDIPTALLCLEELSGLLELALWDNDGLSGEVPDEVELVRAVERAVLRDVAEDLELNESWFDDDDVADPFDFSDWHEGVTTVPTEGNERVTELDFTGEGITGVIPESVFELEKLTAIRTGCGVTLEVEEPETDREKVEVIPADDCPTAASGDGGCALGQGGSSASAFGLLLATLLVFAALGRKKALS